MSALIFTSPWAEMALIDLEQLIVWLDWAEHHAAKEHSIAHPSTEAGRRNDWDRELRKLSRTQTELRAIWEARTGQPLSRLGRS